MCIGISPLLTFPARSPQAEDAQRLLGLERATTDWMTLYQRRCGESEAGQEF